MLRKQPPQLTGSEKFITYQVRKGKMKYSSETFGRAEAVFNKLGGQLGVELFLSEGSQAGLTPEYRAYLANSDTPRVLRDLFRGWGNYQTKSGKGGDTFSLSLSYLTDRTLNLSKSSLRGENPSDKEVVTTFVVDEIEMTKMWLAEFRTRENVPLRLEGWLDEIKDALRKGDYLTAFETASNLKGYIAGVEWFTDLLRPEE